MFSRLTLVFVFIAFFVRLNECCNSTVVVADDLDVSVYSFAQIHVSSYRREGMRGRGLSLDVDGAEKSYRFL